MRGNIKVQLFFILILGSLVFILGLTLPPFFYDKYNKINEVQASLTQHNLSGWAWSENIGWISFNSGNCDFNGDGKSDGDGRPNGVLGCPPEGTSIVNYGVNVNSNGVLSGWAWSENIGWISFDNLTDCPSGACEAKFDRNTGAVLGWARACSGTVNGDCNSVSRSDGWDGWIHLRNDKDGDGIVNNDNNDTGSGVGDYGVYIEQTSPCAWKGWAWGSDVVGWISFAGSNYGVVGRGNGCIITNNKPSVSDLSITEPNYCEVSYPTVIFSWTFFDSDNEDTQKAYRVQVDDNDDFSSPVDDSCPSGSDGTCVSSSSNTYTIPSGRLEYDTTYYWRVRVWDSSGGESDWVEGDSFRTPSHQYPQVDFTVSSSKVIIGQEISFTSTSICDGGCVSYSWSFLPDGNPITSNQEIATTTFTSAGKKDIVLEVTDGDYTCSKTQQINASKNPIWIEIPPSSNR